MMPRAANATSQERLVSIDADKKASIVGSGLCRRGGLLLVENGAQHEAHDLARSRPRDFRNDMHGLRHFVGRETRPAVVEETVAIEVVALLHGDEDDRHLA